MERKINSQGLRFTNKTEVNSNIYCYERIWKGKHTFKYSYIYIKYRKL